MSTFKTNLFLTALFTFSCSAVAAPTTVNVYAEEYFSAEWGPGPEIKSLFEQAQPQCAVNFIPFDSRSTMFNRLRLEGNRTKADVVIGLDHNSVMEEARQLNLFEPHHIDTAQQLDMGFPWTDQIFLPYDFGRYAFVYDKNKLKTPPKSLKELVERQDVRVIYQDPRTSSVGRGLIIWMNRVYPQENIKQAWQTLAKHTVTVGKGWTESYGAFLKGEADMVLSYNTSPLYHLLNEQKDHYAAADFEEGGIVQIELAAKVAGKKNACSEPLLQFLVRPEAQKVIALKNVMLPVIAPETEPHFDALKATQRTQPTLDSRVDSHELKQWIEVWQQALIAK